MKAFALIVILAACSGKTSTTTTGSGTGSPTGSGSGSGPLEKPDPNVTTCESARQKVEDLYRAEGMTRKDAKRIDAYVADNWQMVVADCTKQPAKVVPCLASVSTVADLEAKCLEQVDDEGTEGDKLKR